LNCEELAFFSGNERFRTSLLERVVIVLATNENCYGWGIGKFRNPHKGKPMPEDWGGSTTLRTLIACHSEPQIVYIHELLRYMYLQAV
jgi:hypothetical protein